MSTKTKLKQVTLAKALKNPDTEYLIQSIEGWSVSRIIYSDALYWLECPHSGLELQIDQADDIYQILKLEP